MQKIYSVYLESSTAGFIVSPTRSIIITGANSGLGFETAKLLLQDPQNEVVIACRSAASGASAVQALERLPGRATWLELDLSKQASIRTFVEQFRGGGFPPLYALVCNAGTQEVVSPKRTAEGFESTFGVNHLGHYLLSRLLLSDIVPNGRITIVASGVHDPKQSSGMPPPVYTRAPDVANDFEPGRIPGLRRYSTSKLCNVMHCYELSRRLAGSGDARLTSISVNALDPGFMPGTGLARSWPTPLRWISDHILPALRLVHNNTHHPRVSARRVVALTTGPEGRSGSKYYSNGKPVKSSDQSYDEQVAKELWTSSAAMTGESADLT